MLKELFPGSTDFYSGHFQDTPNIKTFFGYADGGQLNELFEIGRKVFYCIKCIKKLKLTTKYAEERCFTQLLRFFC